MSQFAARYFFDGGSCLWPGDETTDQAFGIPLDLDLLQLSHHTLAEIEHLGSWYDQHLNWDYPPDPGPWQQEECDRFNLAATNLLSSLRVELGPAWVIQDECGRVDEDPDLDRYLIDAKGFLRHDRLPTGYRQRQSNHIVEYYLMRFPVSNQIKGAAFSVVGAHIRTWRQLHFREGKWIAAPELNKHLFGDGGIMLHPVDRIGFIAFVRGNGKASAAANLDDAIEEAARP